MPRRTKYLHYSALLMTSASALFFTAFFSLYWLQNDENSEQLHHLGLFKACWKNLNETSVIPKHFICSPIYHKHGNDDSPHLTSAFLGLCQTCFGFSFFPVVTLVVAHVLYFAVRQEHNPAFSKTIVTVIRVTSGLTVLLTTISLISFGIFKSHPNWIHRSEHNYFSWSFYAASLSDVLYLLVAVTAFGEANWLNQIAKGVQTFDYEMTNLEEN